MAAAAVAGFSKKQKNQKREITACLAAIRQHSEGGLEQPDIQLASTFRAQVSTNLTNYSNQYLFYLI